MECLIVYNSHGFFVFTCILRLLIFLQVISEIKYGILQYSDKQY